MRALVHGGGVLGGVGRDCKLKGPVLLILSSILLNSISSEFLPSVSYPLVAAERTHVSDDDDGEKREERGGWGGCADEGGDIREILADGVFSLIYMEKLDRY